MMKKPQLFLLHFAGGSCYSFRHMEPFLKDFEVVTPELPGRGQRMRENLLNDFEQAAEDMYRQVISKLNSSRFVLYGHSMGAYLALRVANMLDRASTPPACLLVSGNAGPGIYSPKKRYLLEHDEFFNEVGRLGGLPPEILSNKEILEFYEPILRADFEVAERNNTAMEPPVNMPLFAMMGDKEGKVGQISNWQRFTNSSFNYEILEGDHFFINHHPEKIAGIIRSNYEQATLAGKYNSV
ncbi:Surfactin synthase thioesterase subunit [Chitinophaga sp. CF118]|uniref:thioesterase II family protein n=1 Tax=Chitinophaga sp. CF118 TaxID=1884367 RepID=UPI0008E7995F|nr:alpha/beta fold hydrolase [Chitinophaga sp. CF118]SFF06883.1 Surfactin synthase thioesterase subunit [Chitinophaga sp. CF118]